MSGAALLDEVDDPPINALLLSVVPPDAEFVSLELEEAGDSFAAGVLLSAGRSVPGVGD